MDWLCSGRVDDFRYVYVDRVSQREVDEADVFENGGSIEYNDLTSIKQGGALPFIGLPDVSKYLRVYSVSDLMGEVVEILHGTFIVSTPASTIKYASRVGLASMYSLLQIPAVSSPNGPIVIPAGTNPITYAKTVLTNLGLSVIADTSNMALSTDKIYDSRTKWLEIINDLCTMAGFASAGVDPSGNIRLYAYIDPTTKMPTVQLYDDARCPYFPEIQHEFDYFDVPNVFKAIMSNDEVTMTAIARNDDPRSIYSTVNRGYEISEEEEVSDIASQGALQDFANRRIIEKSSSVESIDVSHVYIPYDVGDIVDFKHRLSGFECVGQASKKKLTLISGMPSEAHIRRFVRG